MPDRYLDGLLRFGRFLRARGLPVTPARLMDLTVAVPECDLRDPQDLFLAGRAILVDRMEDLPTYEAAFYEFWGPRYSAAAPEGSPHALPHVGVPSPSDSDAPPISRAQPGEPKSRRFGKPVPTPPLEAEPGEGEGAGKLSYSPTESIHRKELGSLSADEIRQARKLVAEMAWSVASRRSRRLVRAGHGPRVDWRRTLRRNVRHGGVLLELDRQAPKIVDRPVVAICDVSGSMDRYTRPILHFIHAMTATRGRTESFVFGTRLTRVTRLLGGRDPDGALVRVSEEVRDWSGGTRIGESLAGFNSRWARRVLGSGAVVLIVSDGWDKGDPVQLQQAMARLQRRCHRLIWLNPAFDGGGRRPLPVGMRAALPFVDDLLPARNLEDLAELNRLLGGLRPGRPVRPRPGAVPA